MNQDQYKYIIIIALIKKLSCWKSKILLESDNLDENILGGLLIIYCFALSQKCENKQYTNTIATLTKSCAIQLMNETFTFVLY